MIHITATIEIELPNGEKLTEMFKVSRGDRTLRSKGLLAYWLLVAPTSAGRKLHERIIRKLPAIRRSARVSRATDPHAADASE
jgi:hypothetical protein